MRYCLDDIEVYSIEDMLVLVCEDERCLNNAVDVLEKEGVQVIRRPTRRANMCIATVLKPKRKH